MTVPVSSPPGPSPAIRRCWRPMPQSDPRRRWGRYVRRGLCTLLLLGLAAGLVWIVMPPFWHPNTHLVLLTGADARLRNAPPLPFAADDRAAFEQLRPALHQEDVQRQPVVLAALRSRAALQSLGADLGRLGIRRRDVLILYVASHAMCRDGQVYLLGGDCDPAPAPADSYPLRDLLAGLAAVPAQVKLLLLDAGRVDYEPRWGLLVDEVPARLAQEVAATGDARLWVLTARAPLERSHVSHALQQSLFGHFVSRGLLGEADLDASHTVDLEELHRFVSANVTAWVRHHTDGGTVQTPVLLNGAGGLPGPGSPVLLSISPFQRTGPEPSLLALAESARSQSFIQLQPGLVPTLPQPPTVVQPQALLPRAAGRVVQLGPVDLRAAAAAAQKQVPPGAPAPEPPEAPPPEQSAKAGTEKTPTAEDEQAGTREETKPAKLVSPKLLLEAWRLRDALENPDLALPQPVDFAPHLWRAFQEQLLRDEQLFRSVREVDDATLARALRKTHLPLRQWLPASDQDTSEPLEIADGVALRMAQSRPPIGFPVEQPRSLALAELAVGRQGRSQSGATAPDRNQRGSAPNWLITDVGHQPTSLPPELRAAIEALDGLIAHGQRPDLDKWLAELPAEYDQFLEIRLARQLAGLPAAPWATVQLALRTRRRGEQVAAPDPGALDWIVPKVEEADQFCLAGERELRDHVGAASAATATRLLTKAFELYDEAGTQLVQLRAARRLSNELAVRLPYYLRWHRAAAEMRGGEGPSFGDLMRLLETLAALDAQLRKPQPEAIPTLTRLAAQLQILRSAVERGLQPSVTQRLIQGPVRLGDAQRIEILLSTPLLPADTRLSLLQAATKVDTQLAARYTPITDPATASWPAEPTAGDWQRAVRQAELEGKLASLAAMGDSDSEAAPGLTVAYAAMAREGAAATESGNDRRWEAFRDWGVQVRDFYATLPRRVSATTERCRDLADPQSRAGRLRMLRAAWQAQRLMSPWDAAQAATGDPSGILRQAAWYDLLLWHRQRFWRACQDAPPEDLAYLAEAADHYRRLAQAVPQQPQIREVGEPRLQLAGPDTLSLATEMQQEVELKLRYEGPPETPGWLVLKYDPELLDVVPREAPSALDREDRLRAELEQLAVAARTRRELKQMERGPSGETPPNAVDDSPALVHSDRYPYRPEFASHPPTFRFPAGRELTWRFLVRRVGHAEHPARLIVKAVAGPAYVRRTIEIGLPAPEGIALTLGGIAGTWSPTGDGVTLHPFPNRATDYQLNLVNHSGQTKTVDVEVCATAEAGAGALPLGGLSPADAERILTRFGSRKSLFTLSEVALPAEPTPVPLPFPEESAEGAPPAAPPAAAAASGSAAPPARRVPDRGALLLIVTDRESRQQTLKRLAVEPQRPRRFLKPQVRYNRNRQRLEIRIAPQHVSLMPAGAVRVRAELIEPLPPDAERRLEGTLTAPHYTADLYAEVAAAEQRVVTVLLHVDGYPRGFCYRVPCGTHAVDVPEVQDRLEVRVAKLPGGRNYRPDQAVPVQLQVDAPESAFRSGEAVVEVGVDVDRDRELENERVVTLPSDRQASVVVAQARPDGGLTLDTHVGDWTIELPLAGLENAPANVIAHLVLRQTERWSEPAEVVFDALPPRIHRIEVDPERACTVGEALTVVVWATDDGLSGIAKIEIGLDVKRDGTLAAELKPKVAQQDPEGRWTAKLETGDYPPGEFALLVRASDQLGNSASASFKGIRLLAAEQAEAERKKLRTPVRGAVLHGNAPVANVRVTLVALPDDKPNTPPDKGQPPPDKPKIPPAVSDEQGRFLFLEVVPGKYQLRAEGLLYNKIRTVNQLLTVPPPPQNTAPLTLRIP